MRSFEEDLKTARLERAVLIMDEVLRSLPMPPITGGLIHEVCQCMRYPCPHSGTAVFPLHYYR